MPAQSTIVEHAGLLTHIELDDRGPNRTWAIRILAIQSFRAVFSAFRKRTNKKDFPPIGEVRKQNYFIPSGAPFHFRYISGRVRHLENLSDWLSADSPYDVWEKGGDLFEAKSIDLLITYCTYQISVSWNVHVLVTADDNYHQDIPEESQ